MTAVITGYQPKTALKTPPPKGGSGVPEHPNVTIARALQKIAQKMGAK